jgi:hypothetical protein
MNIIGKIFLFAVFIMSLVLMTLAGAIAISHRDWQREVLRKPEECRGTERPGYKYQIEEAERERVRLEASITRLQQQVAESEQARDQVVAKLQSALLEKNNDLVRLKDENQKLEATRQELSERVADISRRSDEAQAQVKALAQQVADQQAKVDAQVDRSAELSAELAESKSFLTIAEERKAQLEQQLVNARLLLQQSGLDIDSLPKDRVPTLDGQVVAVASGLIEVSLGSDDGLQVDHVLEVFRAGQYVGRAVVTSVKPDRAVARIVKDYARGIVQQGDRVTTRLKT